MMLTAQSIDYPVDTSQFTPLQMQPRTVLSIGLNNTWRLLSQRGLSFPEFVENYQHGLVIVGLDIDYKEPHRFEDAGGFSLLPTMSVRRRGMQMEFSFDFCVDGRVVTTVSALGTVLELSGDAAMGASPGRLKPEVMAKFGPEEIDPSTPERPARAALRQLEGSSPVATGDYPFHVSRHHCEVADQWSFIEIAGWANGARERAVMLADNDALRDTLSKPMRRFRCEISRPMYYLDDGNVHTEAHVVGDRTIFHHTFDNVTHGTRTCQVIEEF